MASGPRLRLADHATLQAIATSSGNYAVVGVIGVSDVEVTGGHTKLLLDVLIENVHTENNASYGIMAWLGFFPPPPATDQLKITITNHTDTGSTDGAIGLLEQHAAEGCDITIN